MKASWKNQSGCTIHLCSKVGHKNIHELSWLNICMYDEQQHLPFDDFRPNFSFYATLKENKEIRVHVEGMAQHLLIHLSHTPVLRVSVPLFTEICPVYGTRDQVWAGGEISTPLHPLLQDCRVISLSGVILLTCPSPVRYLEGRHHYTFQSFNI